jgi:hypothetical protein
MKHLLFFGKSQSFTFKAYDEDAPIGDYSHFIKDFDRLESTVFTIDAVDNGEIVGRYRFSHAGRQYSLLKMYSYAQAFSGYRVEGSTYGVAFLSDRDIAITDRNIKLLKSLKDSFAQLSLNGTKFKYEDFSSDTGRIWQGFKNQSFFEKIDFSDALPSVLNPNPAGVQVDDITQLNEEVQSISNGRNAVYLTSDRPHLERAKRKWDQYFDIYLKEDGRYVMNPLPKAVPKSFDETSFVPDKKTTFKPIGNPYPAPDEKTMKRGKTKQHDRHTGILWIFGVLIMLIVMYLFFDRFFFNRRNTESPVPSVVPVVKPMEDKSPKPSPGSLNGETFVWVLTRYDSLKKADKSRKAKLRQEILLKLNEAGIDTNKVGSIVK